MSAQGAVVTVLSAQVAYPVNPQFAASFEVQRWTFTAATGGSQQLLISFDGVNDHGALLVPNSVQSSLAPLRMFQLGRQAWFRLGDSVPPTNITVAVTAEDAGY